MRKKLCSVLYAGLLLLLTATRAYSGPGRIYIAFRQEVPANNLAIDQKAIISRSQAYQHLQEQYGLQLINPFAFSEQKLEEMAANALRLTGSDASVQDLKRIFGLKTANLSAEESDALLKQLRSLDIISYVSVLPDEPIMPPGDIAPVTQNFESLQTYIGPDPGVNMKYAWDRGFYGQNVKFRDVEYGVNIHHEDLEDQNIYIQPGKTLYASLTTAFTEHGTAVFGILAANKGDYGITGMVHQVMEGVLYPEYTEEDGYDRPLAVSSAINNTDPGDVIVLEMQASGVSGYAPAEYDYVIWSLTKAATDAGAIIVAAAGNGNQDLDDVLYEDYMNRGNSGAILVGAGSNNTAHTRLSYSTHGSRVDLQGWGQQVFSTGYGDVYQVGGDFNQSYTSFSGTSSATPVVAACVINLQSYYRSLTGGRCLTGQQIKTILQHTGIPQGNAVAGNIGPLPDMKPAMEYVASTVKIKDSDGNIGIYPNPAREQLFIYSKDRNAVQSYSIYNMLGQQLSSNIPAPATNTIDISLLAKGNYVIQLRTAQGLVYCPFVKE